MVTKISSFQKRKVIKRGKINVLSPFHVAGEEGLEPPLTVLETAALPLYYSPMC